MNQILWTKECNVNHDNGTFKVFIAEHLGEKFYSSILYYEKTGSWIQGEDIILDFKLKTFIAESESEALEKIIIWIDNNLPGKYQLTELEKKA